MVVNHANNAFRIHVLARLEFLFNNIFKDRGRSGLPVGGGVSCTSVGSENLGRKTNEDGGDSAALAEGDIA